MGGLPKFCACACWLVGNQDSEVWEGCLGPAQNQSILTLERPFHSRVRGKALPVPSLHAYRRWLPAIGSRLTMARCSSLPCWALLFTTLPSGASRDYIGEPLWLGLVGLGAPLGSNSRPPPGLPLILARSLGSSFPGSPTLHHSSCAKPQDLQDWSEVRQPLQNCSILAVEKPFHELPKGWALLEPNCMQFRDPIVHGHCHATSGLL